jgi:hypothetical protein
MGNVSNHKPRSFLYPPHFFPPFHLHLYLCCRFIMSQFLSDNIRKSSRSSQKDGSFTCKVTLWHVRVTIVAGETQQCVLCVLFITYLTVDYTKLSKVLSWKRSSGFYFVFLCHTFLSTIYKFFIVAKEMRT